LYPPFTGLAENITAELDFHQELGVRFLELRRFPTIHFLPAAEGLGLLMP
jgi:hypothetical protein